MKTFSFAVRGPMMSKRPVFLIDLDGTLIDANSYHMLLVNAMIPNLRSGLELSSFAKIWCMAARRLIRRLSRSDHKRGVQAVLRDSPRRVVFLHNLVRKILKKSRPEMMAILEWARERKLEVILTTAALEDYARPVGVAFGIYEIVCTEFVNVDSWSEAIGATKAQRTLQLLMERGLSSRDRILFSDHSDDLPLADLCSARFWVPSTGVALIGRVIEMDKDFDLAEFDAWSSKIESTGDRISELDVIPFPESTFHDA